ncbi:MAG TPA: capsule assembly Wzi family protein, partial [Myxococcota bacterium]|nr:capsule assembly Wzi family protein [Myxococcota bacterium]
MSWGRAALALALPLLASAALARGVSPYLPLELDPELERAVERLLVLAGEPVLVRPIATATVLDALPRACRFDAALCERVRSWLERLEARAALTHASSAAGAGSEGWPLPNRHGLGAGDAWQSAARLELRPLDHALVSLGFVAQEGDATPSGSLLSVGESALQLDFGWRTHWLSPFTDSAMLLSANAPAMPSLTLSSYRPLTRLGIRYALFLARMSESDEIEFRGDRVSGHPRLAGVHLSISPVPGWSLGVNRIEQYGGGPRDDSLGKLVRAFIDPEAYDNTSESLSDSDQFG